MAIKTSIKNGRIRSGSIENPALSSSPPFWYAEIFAGVYTNSFFKKGLNFSSKEGSYSWVSLGYVAVNLSGSQPKMYWRLCCTGVKKSYEVANICCQTQGQLIQWKTISLRWLCIDLELTPLEIMTSRETQEYRGSLSQFTNWKIASRITDI